MRLLIRSVVSLAVSLGLLACTQIPADAKRPEEKAADERPPSTAELLAEQDKAAESADRAADQASAAANPVEGFAPLPQGPELTPSALLQAIAQVAKSLQSQADMAPENVAQVMGLELRPDTEGRRTGAQGTLGSGRYEIAIWKPYARHPGHTIEIRVRPSEACAFAFKPLHDQLVAAGFGISKNAPGFKPEVYFDRAAAGNLGLYVIARTDQREAPRCVSIVTLEMEPRDG
ncbi:hypothetical protein HEP73_01248 [Xanthomonas sp. GW]|uniref:hypothetical protein n=1 Tax=Xanthomonas sp. GW TaxID=2724121 RepID=UPI001860EDF2|nr:hypothetical protein [Xanthomonas sp. GW]QNH20348.1 hypothetical protein HEP73_01248 [Xanthomonas sp. GW]